MSSELNNVIEACATELGYTVDTFMDLLRRNNLTIQYTQVKAIGYEGEIVYVPFNDKSLFNCAYCKNPCVTGYNEGRCYDCAIEHFCDSPPE